MKRFWMHSAALVVLTAAFLPAHARTDVGVSFVINTPPPVRYEAVPTPRSGYVWMPGYWNGRRHAWTAGHWAKAHYGRRYAATQWHPQNSNRQLQPGRWARSGDQDRDGIFDRADRDRDGDGVPNHRDFKPGDRRFR